MYFRLQQLQQQVAAQIKMKGYRTNIYQFSKMVSIKNCITLFFSITALQCGAQAPAGTVRLTDSVACTAVGDQGAAPVCWTFGTNSLFEADLLRTKGLQLNLSEMYYARYAYIDKAQRFLATQGKTYFEGGGQFHDVIRVIERYGMVPEAAYPGKASARRQHDHTLLDTAMQRLVKRWQRLGLTTLQPKHLRQLNDSLNKYLGKPPARFLYNGKWHTPRSFADTYLHFANDYLELVAFADKPLYQKHVLVDRYNWANDSFYNISLADMQMVADSALAAGWSLGWEGDVTENGFQAIGGYASWDTLPADVDDKRLTNYQTLATERDHMLHLVGAGYDSLGKRWYYQKNSWGHYNRFNGYLYMDENYFLYKTVILFVNKAALTPTMRARLRLNDSR